jgi:hypothetical protein
MRRFVTTGFMGGSRSIANTDGLAVRGVFLLLRGGIAAALLTLVACGSGGDESAQGPPPLAPTLASIQTNVFSVNCALSGCHTGNTPAQGLRLDPGESYRNIVNVPSQYGGMLVRVIPGDPDESFLIQKLEGTQMFGDRMPANGPPYLPLATIDVIREWIQNGALP